MKKYTYVYKTESRTSQFFRQNAIIVRLLVSIIAVVVIAILCHKFSKNNIGLIAVKRLNDIISNDGYADLLFSCLSLTFITISISSILSDRSITIYWKNVSEERLIRPLFGCFYAYTTYSFVLSLAVTISFVLKEHLLEFAYFLMNIVVLILLSCKMIDIYYNRDQKKIKYRQELQKICSRYDKYKQQEKQNIYTTDKTLDKINEELKNNTLRAIQNSDYAVVVENLNLMGKFAHYLDKNNLFFVKNLEGKYLLRSKIAFCKSYIFEMERKVIDMEGILSDISSYDQLEMNAPIVNNLLEEFGRINVLRCFWLSLLESRGDDLTIVDDVCVLAYEILGLHICQMIVTEYLNCLLEKKNTEDVVNLYFMSDHLELIPETITYNWDYKRYNEYKDANIIIESYVEPLLESLLFWYCQEYGEPDISQEGEEFALNKIKYYWSGSKYLVSYLENNKEKLIKEIQNHIDE